MNNIKPTRMELLKIRKRIKLAKKGHKLLKQKQDVLIFEFFAVMREIKSIRLNLANKLTSAQQSLFNAISIEGNLDIERVSMGLSDKASLVVKSKNIMGVPLPVIDDIKVNYQWPGYLDQSIEFDNALIQYRNVFPDLMKLSEKQLILGRLASEIKKTKRRVNSLENLTIPRLVKASKEITIRLEELERENFSRLKFIKKIKEE